MKNSKSTKLAYAAGIIDGEGSINICKNERHPEKWNPTYSISVDVGMTDGKVIDWMYGMFHGGLCYLEEKENRVEQFRWYLKSQKAADFLKRVQPYLKTKKRQSEIALRLQQRIKKAKDWRKRKSGFRKGFKGHSDHEIAKREELYQAMKKANNSHYKSLALETKRSSGS